MKIPNFSLQDVLTYYVSKLYNEELDATELVKHISNEFSMLDYNIREKILTNIKLLRVISKVNEELDPCHILAGIVFWEYVTNEFAMLMIHNDAFHKLMVKRLSTVSHIDERTMLKIISTWDNIR